MCRGPSPLLNPQASPHLLRDERRSSEPGRIEGVRVRQKARRKKQGGHGYSRHPPTPKLVQGRYYCGDDMNISRFRVFTSRVA